MSLLWRRTPGDESRRKHVALAIMDIYDIASDIVSFVYLCQVMGSDNILALVYSISIGTGLVLSVDVIKTRMMYMNRSSNGMEMQKIYNLEMRQDIQEDSDTLDLVMKFLHLEAGMEMIKRVVRLVIIEN
eukprot:CAMPEP_0203793180 /NCGR_PEP_ID=MMETSP0100_2-20121128/5710_1 /ASSEMBLY_ACC=CAM_ASM_000210 /TAXON_ID=96639 /ORGANISM=" , Strain NY0313808BC1" /LENGTH=129 /DNA_ID=CAMNT_0050696907 /DNA_START=83 /DNA_END=469 /DNA_ORIENTATION=+